MFCPNACESRPPSDQRQGRTLQSRRNGGPLSSTALSRARGDEATSESESESENNSENDSDSDNESDRAIQSADEGARQLGRGIRAAVLFVAILVDHPDAGGG